MTEESYVYVGNELDVFSYAKNWKNYVIKRISKFISGKVLEVGAGQGNNLLELINSVEFASWTAIEPDISLYDKLKTVGSSVASNVDFYCGTIDAFVKKKYDTIIYWDVLEHIKDDKLELNKAASLLNKNGHLIVIVPSWQFLFSDFDASIGHYRRYSRKQLVKAMPSNLKIIVSKYLDSIGFYCSLDNKCLLKQSNPSVKQVIFWDRIIVPFSRVFDRLFFYRFGKTLLMISKKT